MFQTDEFTADVTNGQAFINNFCSAEIVDYKYNKQKRRNVYIVKIIDKIVSKFDKYSQIETLTYKYGFKSEFEQIVLDDAKKISKFTNINERVNLENKLVVTIDGKDAKDLDDAISLEMIDSNYLLTVSIADVSYYVSEGSLLDNEAFSRATSVYLVDRVLPMLPKVLSDDLCSLNTKDKKATISVSMLIDKKGNVIKHQIFQSYIKSKYRLDYETVNEFYDNKYSYNDNELEKMLNNLKKLKNILENKRYEMGSLDFETIEHKITIDNNLNVTNVTKRQRGISEKVIEECMLLANETVAKHMSNIKVPFVYRIHDTPDYEKLNLAIKIASEAGVKFKGNLTNVHDLRDFVDELNNKELNYITNGIVLRSMAKAIYNEKNTGHFGLQSEYYTHFTSPIRRYPDLIVHRMIREFIIKNDFTKEKINKYNDYMSEAAKHCSNKEQDAVDFEREVEKIFIAKYMKQFEGKTYNGTITSITKFGFFVELDNGIEGLVHFENLDTFFEYKEYYVIDEYGKIYKLGDKLDFIVKEVDLDESKIRLIPKKNKR